ncbi:MAG: hypothetical protein SV062_08160 [Thermodesulfobacteriota bacterium]|nr:hypothetical protein [Thermodesulfobacteriota bacterium]
MDNSIEITDEDFLNYERYATKFLKVVHIENKSIVPFVIDRDTKLNIPVRRLHKIWEADAKEGKPIRYIILKARREFISTYVQSRMYYNVATKENRGGVIIAQDNDGVQSIFNITRIFHDETPNVIKPMKRFHNRNELRFENPDKEKRSVDPGLRSGINIYLADNIKEKSGEGSRKGRGGAHSYLHLSEYAFYKNADIIKDAFLPVIMEIPDTFVVIESTANMAKGAFYDEWQAAINGDSQFKPIFFKWSDHPLYKLAFRNDKLKEDFKLKMNEEEKELFSKYNLSLEQLHWRRIKASSFSNIKSFRREYPITPEEAFILAGDPIFDLEKLKIIKERFCAPPKWQGRVFGEKLIPYNEGELKIWYQCEREGKYVVGADPSSGTGEDPGCIEVFKDTGVGFRQVAEWHGYTDAYELGRIARYLAKQYNNALLSIETTGGWGSAAQDAAKVDYYNFFRHRALDNYVDKIGSKIGWDTNTHTKGLLVSYATLCVNNLLLEIHSDLLLDEMMKFVQQDFFSYGATRGNYDDRVMATMIAIYTYHLENRGGGNTGVLTPDEYNIQKGSNKKPLSEVNINLRVMTDYINPSESFQHDDNWMNL